MSCHFEPCPFMTHGPRSTLLTRTEFFLETGSMITGPSKTREAASDGVHGRVRRVGGRRKEHQLLSASSEEIVTAAGQERLPGLCLECPGDSGTRP